MKTVLIVEDEPLIAADIEFTIREAGYKVLGIAHTATKALDLIHSHNPDLVLLDISLKGSQSGIEIGRVLRKQYEIPFIYITSFADKVTLEMAKETLPYGYIVKPFKERDIVSTIEIALFRFDTESKKNILNLDHINSTLSNNLTQREFDIIQKIWEGKSNNQISQESFVSINTVKTHIKNIFSKLSVGSRSEVITYLRNLK